MFLFIYLLRYFKRNWASFSVIIKMLWFIIYLKFNLISIGYRFMIIK